MSKSKPPKWMREHVDHCTRAFGLEKWRIELHPVDTIDDEPTTTARVYLRTPYLIADILVRVDADPEYNGYIALTHEMLHIAIAQQDHAVKQMSTCLPKRERKTMHAVYVDAQEQDVERMARALTPLIRSVST